MTDTESKRSYDDPPYTPGRRQPTGWVGMVVFAGVMLLMLGGFQIVEGLVALFRDDFYVVGVIIAVFSALANLAFLPAYPIWSTIVIALDVLVIYALTAHGREVRY